MQPPISSTSEKTKAELAEHQLDRAIRLFLEEKDYVCAITLAGAAEEIFGKLLENQGLKPALASVVDACVDMGQKIYKEAWPRKGFVAMENSYRDGLKHITDGNPLTVTREAAVEIIDRAVQNYVALGIYRSQCVQNYLSAMHSAA